MGRRRFKTSWRPHVVSLSRNSPDFAAWARLRDHLVNMDVIFCLVCSDRIRASGRRSRPAEQQPKQNLLRPFREGWLFFFGEDAGKVGINADRNDARPFHRQHDAGDEARLIGCEEKKRFRPRRPADRTSSGCIALKVGNTADHLLGRQARVEHGRLYHTGAIAFTRDFVGSSSIARFLVSAGKPAFAPT